MHYLTAGKDKDAFRAAIRPLAKQYKDYIQFAITDLAEYPEMLATFGLDARAKTGLALQNPSSGEMFPYRGGKTATAAVVDAFLNDIVDGKIQPLTGGDQRTQADGEHDEL